MDAERLSEALSAHRLIALDTLQGLRASYDSRIDGLWIEGRSKSRQWEPLGTYAKEFEHPLWKRLRETAKSSGHGGADFFVVHEFLRTVRTGRKPPIDACDAAAWSAIIPLSAKSLAEGIAPQEIPDFTQGKWHAPKA